MLLRVADKTATYGVELESIQDQADNMAVERRLGLVRVSAHAPAHAWRCLDRSARAGARTMQACVLG